MHHQYPLISSHRYKLRPQLSCTVHPTLLIVFFLMSSKPSFPLVTSCFRKPNLTPPQLFPSSLAGLTPSCPLSPSVPQSLHLFTPKLLCELHRALAVCLRMAAALILPSQLSCWPGRIYSGDVSTWQEGPLSSLLCYLPEVTVAHFKASANPSYSSSILSFC